MIVVDTNVIASLWIPGDSTEAAESLFKRDPEWAAPLLWRSELRNVLAACIRRGLLELVTAQQVMDDAEDLLREYAVPSARVLERATTSGCTAYDCEFVVLAEDLKTRLITCDRQLLQQFPSTARSLFD